MNKLLRLEALAVLVLSVALYARFGAGWGTFAALFLVPDLSLLGYLGGPRVGAAVYNVGHSYVGALALTAIAPAYGLIWVAHCAFDRTLGYGLKLPEGFRHTHLGLIGRAAA